MNLSPRFRIVIGILSLLISVLLGAMVLRIVPDRREAVIEGRSRLCEAIAVNSSVLISRDDIRRIQAILTVLVDRHEDIESAGLRQDDGTLVVEIGPHSAHWISHTSEKSSDSQVYVPLQNASGRWGVLEVRFTPVNGGLWFEVKNNPWVRLIGFVVMTSGVLWYFYLGLILEQLNPSQAIPGRVRESLDTLAEGLVVVDRKGRIALCNRALAGTLGEEPEALIGKRVEKLSWLCEIDSDDGFIEFPWQRVLDGSETLSHGRLRLRASDGTVRMYQTHCAPVIGKGAEVRGVFCSFEDVTELEYQKIALAESKAEADAANQAKSQFLANMSH